jgi:hypothetical protein
VRRWAFESSLSIFFLVLFLASLIGQSLAGQRVHNAEAAEHDDPAISWFRYVTSSDFGQAVMENWRSEFLQFTLFILATIWLVQRGSAESKPPEEAGQESDQKERIGGYGDDDAPAWARARGLRTAIYSHSLLLTMAAIFLASWLAQSLTSWRSFNEEQAQHGESTIAWATYLLEPDFWEKTLQNWQSEFLAVGTMAVFTIYLRSRGSPESKPVGAPHHETTSN